LSGSESDAFETFAYPLRETEEAKANRPTVVIAMGVERDGKRPTVFFIRV